VFAFGKPPGSGDREHGRGTDAPLSGGNGDHVSPDPEVRGQVEDYPNWEAIEGALPYGLAIDVHIQAVAPHDLEPGLARLLREIKLAAQIEMFRVRTGAGQSNAIAAHPVHRYRWRADD
jgi:hypothetical protein